MGASISGHICLSVLDAAQNPPGPVRQKTVNPSDPGPAQQSQTHSGVSRDRPVTGPYYYDRKH